MSRHTCLCPIRWGDLDAQGHVNNAVVVDYLQEARVDFLVTGPIPQMLDAGVIVVNHQVEYLRPIPFSLDPVRIQVWADSVGGARFALSYEVFVNDDLVGRARTVATPYDLAVGTIRRLTDVERSALRGRLHPAVDLRALAAAPVSTEQPAIRWPLRVRWSDLDSYGHVNNVKFYDYLQEARVELLGDAWSSDEMIMLLVRQDVDYVRPMDFMITPYTVELWVTLIGTTSLTIVGLISDPAGVVYARGRSVVVCADQSGRPVAVPDRLRRVLSLMQQPAG